MRSTTHLHDGLVGLNGVVTVLEVEAVGEMGVVLEEDIADRTVDNLVHGWYLYKHATGKNCIEGEYGLVQTWREIFASSREGRLL